jgi:hypothetical protein
MGKLADPIGPPDRTDRRSKQGGRRPAPAHNGAMAGKAGRVRVVLERSGGLLGRPVRRGLDSADLPEPEAARLRDLVRVAVSSGGVPGRQAGGAAGAGGAGGAPGAGGAGQAGDAGRAGRTGRAGGAGGAPQGGPADGGQGGGADRFVYTLEIDYIPEVDGPSKVDHPAEVNDAPAADHAARIDQTSRVDQQGGRAVRTFSEPIPEDLRPLLALLRAAPLLPASGHDTPR